MQRWNYTNGMCSSCEIEIGHIIVTEMEENVESMEKMAAIRNNGDILEENGIDRKSTCNFHMKGRSRRSGRKKKKNGAEFLSFKHRLFSKLIDLHVGKGGFGYVETISYIVSKNAPHYCISSDAITVVIEIVW